MSILDSITLQDTAELVVEDPFEGAPTVGELRAMFQSFDSECQSARDDAFRDRSYYDGDGQVGKLWREKLDKFDLPPIYINKVRRIVDGHLGVLLAQQVDPEAQPRKEQDIDAAAVATKILRYVSDKVKWKQKKADCIEDNYIMGAAAVLIECSNTEVFLDRIPYREFCYDPNSREPDFSDANWLGFSKWIHVDDVKMTWEDSPVIRDIGAGNDLTTVTARGFSKSRDMWVDKKNRRVQVVTQYYREMGRWFYVAWCHAGILDWYESPYQDADGASLCPLVAISCYISGDPEKSNDRYGIVRDMIHPQDEYNAHRAQSLQSVVSRRVQRVPGSTAEHVPDVELKEIAADPRGVIPDGYQMVPDNSLSEQMGLLQLSDSEMQRMGPTPAVLGRSLGASESGRSRQVQAAAGLTEIALILDRVERFEDAVYRMIWSQVRQFWDQQQYIRVTGDDRSYKFIQINKPILDPNEPEIQQYVMGEDGQPVVDEMGQPQIETVPNIVGYENEVATMDMEIIITVVPENVNLEHEVWEQLLQFSGSTGIAPGDPRFLMLLKVAPLTNRREVIEKFEGLMKEMNEQNAAQQEQQAKMQEMQAQLGAQSQQAATAKDAAQAQKYSADAVKTNIENQLNTRDAQIRAVLASNLLDLDGEDDSGY